MNPQDEIWMRRAVELAEHARQFGNEMYPKVLALLADDNSRSPHQFDILFKKHTWRGNPGVTSEREFASTQFGRQKMLSVLMRFSFTR